MTYVGMRQADGWKYGMRTFGGILSVYWIELRALSGYRRCANLHQSGWSQDGNWELSEAARSAIDGYVERHKERLMATVWHSDGE